MEEKLRTLYLKMVEFDRGMPNLIQHFTKVHAYARLIAEWEAMPESDRQTLEAAALVHDIAIPLCLKKYGSDAGSLQQREGPALVREMLVPLKFSEAVVERVCWLVAHHHTYTDIDGLDHQILIEADFLVNAYEGNHSEESRRHTLEQIFRTECGKRLFRAMFDL